MIDSVKIGPLVYQIIRTIRLQAEDGQSLWGWIRHSDCTIQIEEAMVEQRAAVTLLHEITHGIIDQSGLEQNEKLCEVLGFRLFELIRDNPYLIQYIQGIDTHADHPTNL